MSVDRTVAPASTYATTDLEQARAFMTNEFMGHVPKVRAPRDAFRLRVASVDHGSFVRYELAHRGTVESASEPYGGFLVGRLRSGRTRFLLRDADVRLAAGGLYLYPQGSDLVTTWSDVSVDNVVLSAASVEEAGSAIGLPGRVRFEGVSPVSASRADHWHHTIDYVDAVTASIDVPGYPLIADQLARLLASVLLTTFGHRSPDGPRREGRVPTAAVRRALAYVEVHAHEPVGLTQLAGAAGVSPRALQQAFRSQLDTTPIEYARRVRLERAYEDLRTADPTRGDTVADVAARWGFVHLGRFAADFQTAYGRTPRAVLHT